MTFKNNDLVETLQDISPGSESKHLVQPVQWAQLGQDSEPVCPASPAGLSGPLEHWQTVPQRSADVQPALTLMQKGCRTSSLNRLEKKNEAVWNSKWSNKSVCGSERRILKINWPAVQRMSTAFREGDSSVLTRSLPALFTFSSCTERSASSSWSSWRETTETFQN